MPQLQGKWFIDCKTQEEKDKREQTVRNSRFILDILTKLIENELKELSARKIADYDCPSWAYQQADKNGAISALSKILLLTKLEGTN